MKPDWKGASNVAPKKRKREAGRPWSCKCGPQPHYILFCSKCGRGQ